MHRVVNYGSFLQAFALQEILRDLGYECHFIDIKPGRKIVEAIPHINNRNVINFIIKRLDRYFFKRIKHFFFHKNRISRFFNEFFPILGVSKVPNYKSNYDAIIIGSDEIFNCSQKSSWGFAKTLFGEGLESDNIITYAASCGYTTLEKLDQYGIREEVKAAMGNLKAISVRDANTKRFVEELTGNEIHEHLDPTLIYDFEKLTPKSVPEKDYLLVYGYDGRINDKELVTKIKEFAQKEKKKILSVGLYQSWCDKQILCTPFELLAYFKYADYVVTDTFHGTVFSIKYNKHFATIVRDSNKNKLADLLIKFGLIDRQVQDVRNVSELLKFNIDYEEVNITIDEHKTKAIEYLKQSICK